MRRKTAQVREGEATEDMATEETDLPIWFTQLHRQFIHIQNGKLLLFLLYLCREVQSVQAMWTFRVRDLPRNPPQKRAHGGASECCAPQAGDGGPICPARKPEDLYNIYIYVVDI